jgi:U3 small nucleolar ribonucleoprotein component
MITIRKYKPDAKYKDSYGRYEVMRDGKRIGLHMSKEAATRQAEAARRVKIKRKKASKKKGFGKFESMWK